MIISRTPFRVSFFGGGTDYPGWFKDNKGAVLGTTINKYCYISCRYLPQFFDHKSRIIYSKMEHVQTHEEIDHPSVREVLRFLDIQSGVEVHHDGDLPARTGLGSSSSFTVGLLNSFHAMKGRVTSKEQLAKEAIHVEQNMCLENVGCQDQALAAYGGLNYIEFGGTDHLRVNKITISKERVTELEDHLLLYFTGFTRMASEIAKHQIKNIPNKQKELERMYAMARQAVEYLNEAQLKEFGELLHESWMIKRGLSDKVTTDEIDAIYTKARSAGALGGKVLGAGGGGFFLVYVSPERRQDVRRELKDFLEVPIRFEHSGSQIIFYQPSSEFNKDSVAQ